MDAAREDLAGLNDLGIDVGDVADCELPIVAPCRDTVRRLKTGGYLIVLPAADAYTRPEPSGSQARPLRAVARAISRVVPRTGVGDIDDVLDVPFIGNERHRAIVRRPAGREILERRSRCDRPDLRSIAVEDRQ